MHYFPESELNAFWSTLAAKWRKEVHHFRRPFSRPFATGDEFFRILLAWSQWVRMGGRTVSPRWIEDDLLPTAGDKDLARFGERLDAKGEKEHYVYVGDGVQRFNPALWDRAVEVLKPAITLEGGLPPGGVSLDFFHGKYSRTPTGIHCDSADVIAFVTQGPKRLFFWPQEKFSDSVKWQSPNGNHSETGIYHFEKHLDDAIAVEAEAGDVIYWPREYFHIGSSPEHWCGMVTMVLWWFGSFVGSVRNLLPTLLQGSHESYSEPFVTTLDGLGETAAAVDPRLLSAGHVIKKRIVTQLDDAVRDAWAKFVTAYGFTLPPSAREVNLGPDDRVYLQHPCAVLSDGRASYVYACGHRALVTENPGLADVAMSLELGRTYSVDEIMRESPGEIETKSEIEIEGEALLGLLQSLAIAGALRIA
jgi:hypothetical protein